MTGIRDLLETVAGTLLLLGYAHDDINTLFRAIAYLMSRHPFGMYANVS